MKTLIGWIVAILVLLALIYCDAFRGPDPNECYGMTIGKSVKLQAPLDKQAPELDLLLEHIIMVLQRCIQKDDASCLLTCQGEIVVCDGNVVTYI